LLQKHKTFKSGHIAGLSNLMHLFYPRESLED